MTAGPPAMRSAPGRDVLEAMTRRLQDAPPPWHDEPPPEDPPESDLAAPTPGSADGQLDSAARTADEGPPPHDLADLMVDGATFLLDVPAGVPAVWGEADQVLWSEGESLVIAGPQGVGKTTLAGELLRGLLGLSSTVLGLPVRPARRVLFLAMDRPRQAQRALGRWARSVDREVLSTRLVAWEGPPPRDLARHPSILAELARQAGADVVVLDSIKDAAVGLSDDEVGAGYNRARQLLLRSGVELVELHHVVKRGDGGAAPTSLRDVYGSTWITSGAGSVVMLIGEAGDPVVRLRHLKQPAAEVGPLTLLHDSTTGTVAVELAHDLVALAAATGPDGLTAKAAAVIVSERPTPTRADVEKARRRLDALERRGVLASVQGAATGVGGTPPRAWFPATDDPSGAVTGAVTDPLLGLRVTSGTDQSRPDPSHQVRAVTDHVTSVTADHVTPTPPSLEGVGGGADRDPGLSEGGRG